MLSDTGLRPDSDHIRHPNGLGRRVRETRDPKNVPDREMPEKVREEYSMMKPGSFSALSTILGEIRRSNRGGVADRNPETPAFRG
jgi:hypothetical protein